MDDLRRRAYRVKRSVVKRSNRAERTARFKLLERHDREVLDSIRPSFIEEANASSTLDRTRPLVSITVPTYQRGELLVERTIPALLAQTHENIEVIVVGDHCTDATVALMADVRDPRVRFVNLVERGTYPVDPRAKWQVAGVVPLNRALHLATGAWIAHCDDDARLLPHHIEHLLEQARHDEAEFVVARTRDEDAPGHWVEWGEPIEPDQPLGSVPHSATLTRSYLRWIPYRLDSWKFYSGADRVRFERFHRAGVRISHLDEVVVEQPLRPGQRSGTVDFIVEHGYHPSDPT